MHRCVTFLRVRDTGQSLSRHQRHGPDPTVPPGIFVGPWSCKWGRQLGAVGEELVALTLSLALRSASQAMRCSPQSYWPVLTATCKGVLSSLGWGGKKAVSGTEQQRAAQEWPPKMIPSDRGQLSVSKEQRSPRRTYLVSCVSVYSFVQ